jgi:hypothetical protein
MMLLHATPRRKDKEKQKWRELECDDECVRAKEKKIVFCLIFIYLCILLFFKTEKISLLLQNRQMGAPQDAAVASRIRATIFSRICIPFDVRAVASRPACWERWEKEKRFSLPATLCRGENVIIFRKSVCQGFLGNDD